MGQGALRLKVTDLPGEAVSGRLVVDFLPARNSPGGAAMEARFEISGETELIVEGVQCRGGPGTLYEVGLATRDFRRYAFFQLMVAGKENTPSESHVRLFVRPGRVKGIDAPAFSRLPAAAQRFAGGAAFYDGLDPLRKACLLNIAAKAGHASADRCLRFLRSVVRLEQDRCFCPVEAEMPEFLRRSERFKSAPNTLHEPLAGYRLEDSFKSRDAHANLQVTFMRHRQSGEVAADVDIDESSGVEHGFEVIRNAVFRRRTNPYLIRELLLLFDPVEKVLDPGYRFVF